MKCELCHKNNAETVLYRQTKTGKHEELYVCNACAQRERAFEQQHGIQVAAMDASPMVPPELPEELPPAPENFPSPPKKMHPNLTNLFGVNPLASPNPFELGDDDEGDSDIYDTKRCNKCHTSLEENQFGMYLGCTHCYDIFREELRGVFAELQGCKSYKGNIPEWLKERLYKRSIERDLQKAIANDDFEKAKQLTEELRKIEEREQFRKEGDHDEP